MKSTQQHQTRPTIGLPTLKRPPTSFSHCHFTFTLTSIASHSGSFRTSTPKVRLLPVASLFTIQRLLAISTDERDKLVERLRWMVSIYVRNIYLSRSPTCTNIPHHNLADLLLSGVYMRIIAQISLRRRHQTSCHDSPRSEKVQSASTEKNVIMMMDN